jgi:hypothetical protein
MTQRQKTITRMFPLKTKPKLEVRDVKGVPVEMECLWVLTATPLIY